MAQNAVRRPLPALAFLVGLLLLAGLVWWRVIHRSDASPAPAVTKSCTSAPAATAGALPANADVTVQVLNSTQRTGLAGSVAAALTQLGFKQAGVPNNDLTSRAPVAGVAELRFGPAGKTSADLLMYYLPGAVEVPDTRTGAVVDVALGAKYTALATPAAVAAALTAAHVSQAPASAAPATTAPATTAPATSGTLASASKPPTPSATSC